MADIPIDGMVKVWAVAAIADISAPTTTELNAGIRLAPTMTADGLGGFKAETADVDTSSLASKINTATNGRDSYPGLMLRLKKQTGTDTIYDTLVRGFETHIVIRRYFDEEIAWASSDDLEVFPVICAQTSNVSPEPNTLGRYEVPLKLRLDPDIRATVA